MTFEKPTDEIMDMLNRTVSDISCFDVVSVDPYDGKTVYWTKKTFIRYACVAMDQTGRYNPDRYYLCRLFQKMLDYVRMGNVLTLGDLRLQYTE